MAVAAEVPGKYDLALTVGATTTGFTFLRTLDGSIGRSRASYEYTPTFVERQNVSGAYGDDSQAFFLTASQNDWSLGEGQRFFRQADTESKRKYWQGDAVDGLTIPGQVSLGTDANTLTFGSSVASIIRAGLSMYTASSTNLFAISNSGTITDIGAHGASVSGVPSLAYDGTSIYISSTGSTKIRRYQIGGAFSDFCATQRADALAFNNNTLYSIRLNVLYLHDTAGVATALFTWKDATGLAATWQLQVLPYGGKLMILAYDGGRTELYVYDGIGVSKVTEFAAGFIGYAMAVIDGIVFVNGLTGQSGLGARTEVHYYANGSIGRLWSSKTSTTSSITGGSPICDFLGSVCFADMAARKLMLVRIDDGSVMEIGTFTNGDANYLMSCASPTLATSGTVVMLKGDTTGRQWGRGVSSTGTTTSSLFDFDSTLTKLIRGITVDFVAGTDGNGGSVDIAYQIGSVDGSWTTLQTGATSGQEYTLSGISGRSVSVRVTINKGTSTFGPVVKRVYVRAAPILQSYKVRTYNLDLTSTTEHPTRLQDGSDQTLTGYEQAVLLQAAITSSTPITVKDKLGTFTGVCEPANCSIIELHSEGSSPTTPGQFTATIVIREV